MLCKRLLKLAIFYFLFVVALITPLAYSSSNYSSGPVADDSIQLIVEDIDVNYIRLNIRGRLIVKEHRITELILAFPISGKMEGPIPPNLAVFSIPIANYGDSIAFSHSFFLPINWNNFDFPFDEYSAVMFFGIKGDKNIESKPLILQFSVDYYVGFAFLNDLTFEQAKYENLKDYFVEIGGNWKVVDLFIKSNLGQRSWAVFLLYIFPTILTIFNIIAFLVLSRSSSENMVGALFNFELAILVSLPVYHLTFLTTFEKATLYLLNSLIFPLVLLINVSLLLVTLYLITLKQLT